MSTEAAAQKVGEESKPSDAVKDGSGSGSGAGAAAAAGGERKRPRPDAATGGEEAKSEAPKRKNRRGKKYGLVVEGMDEFLGNYPVDVLGRMATLCYFFKKHFKRWVFVGFYMVDPTNASRLTIGPYQGDVLASGLIDFGKGVCGTAAATRETQIVADVSKCDNYIACDLFTKSEIVVPVTDSAGKLLAVLDVDANTTAAFDQEDKVNMETIVAKYFSRPE